MPNSTVYDRLLAFRRTNGCGLLVLLDPDRSTHQEMGAVAGMAQQCGAAGILFGTSFSSGIEYDAGIQAVRDAAPELPVLLFPGNSRQLTRQVDAVLLLSLLSSRNPQYLIGEQVIAAPLLKRLKLETISTGYLLIESGKMTTAEFISGSPPIPRDKPELAMAHALAAEQLGFKQVYLEAGSGAQQAVPAEMIAAVRSEISIPLLVGGGIRSPGQASEASRSGADFVVIGTHFERNGAAMLAEFTAAIRQ